MGFAYQHERCDEVAEARGRGRSGVKLSLKQDKHATKLEKIAFPIHLTAFALQSHVVITQEMLFCFY